MTILAGVPAAPFRISRTVLMERTTRGRARSNSRVLIILDRLFFTIKVYKKLRV